MIFLTVGFYQNITHSNSIINDKKVSYIQVQQAGQWISTHSNPDDLVYSFHTQAELQYSSNRRVTGIPGSTPKEVMESIVKEKPKYVVMNIFANIDPAHEWKVTFPYLNQNIFKPELSFAPFVDKDQKIPILTIFSVSQELYAAAEENQSSGNSAIPQQGKDNGYPLEESHNKQPK